MNFDNRTIVKDCVVGFAGVCYQSSRYILI